MTSSSRRYCCVAGCDNSRSNTNYSFFSLPVNPERRKRWLEIIGRDDLLGRSELKSKSHEICCVHFDQSMVTFVKKLRPHAMPNLLVPRPPGPADFRDFGDGHLSETSNPYDDQIDEIEGKVKTKPYKPRGKRPITSKIEEPDMKYEIEFDKAVNNQLKHEPSSQKSSIVKLRNVGVEFVTHEEEAEDNVTDVKDEPTLAPITVPADPLSILIPEMICDKAIKLEPDPDNPDETPIYCSTPSKNTNLSLKDDSECEEIDQEIKYKIKTLMKWKTEINKMTEHKLLLFSFNLRVSKPGLYGLLKSSLKLPEDSAFFKLNVHLNSVLDATMTGLITAKLSSLGNNAKYCCLLVGRVKVTPQLFYMIDKDDIIGTQNADGNVTNDLAKYAYVAMIQGLSVDWSLPVSITMVSQANFSLLGSWLETIWLTLSKVGLDITSIIFPNTSHFYQFAESKRITYDSPRVSFHTQTYYMLYDLPNLFVQLAQDLQKNDYYLEGATVSWKSIKKVCNLPESDVFTSATAEMLKTSLDRGKIPRNANAIVTVIDTISKVSQTLLKNKHLAIKKRTKDILKGAKKILSKIKPIERQGNFSSTVNFTMLVVTLESILKLAKELKSQKVPLMSKQLNGSVMTEFLKTVRQRRGRKVIPSPRWVHQSLRHFLFRELLSSGDQVGSLLESWSLQETTLQIPNRGPLKLSKPLQHRIQISEQGRVKHMAGFLITKCAEIHSCPKYRSILERLSPLGAWKNPPESFVEYVAELDAAFLEQVKISGKEIGRRLMDAGRAVSLGFVPPCFCFPVEVIIVLFLRLRIFLHCSETNQQYRRERSRKCYI